MTERWWDAAEPAAKLELVDGSNPGMGVAVAVLGFHAIAKAAMSDLAAQTLVDRAAVEAVYDEVDVDPVRKAIKAATTEVMGPVAAGRYADLVIADWLLRGREASSRLTATLVAKGLPWPRAVSRTSAVAGVPLERLGRYATIAATPGLDALSAADAADRVLMDYAASRGALESQTVAKTRSHVSKASQERSRTHEDVPWDESSVKRDEGGRFASESVTAAAERKDRLARRKARRKRAAKRNAHLKAVTSSESAKTSAAPGRQRTVEAKQQQIAGKQKTIKREQLKMTAKQRELFRKQVQANPRGEPEDPPAYTGKPFGLNKLELRHLDPQNPPRKPFLASPAFTLSEPYDHGNTVLWTAQELVEQLNPSESDTKNWIGFRDWKDDSRKDHVDESKPFDPSKELWVMIPTDAKVASKEAFGIWRLPDAATPAIVHGDTTYPVTLGSDEEGIGRYVLNPDEDFSQGSFRGSIFSDDTGDFTDYLVGWPITKVEIQDLDRGGVFKAASAERKRTAEHEQWDESQVKRDEQGQFASESSEASARKRRLENRKKRRARRAKRVESARQAQTARDQADKAKNHPAGKSKQREIERKQRSVKGKQRSSPGLQRTIVRQHSIPPGLPQFSRDDAPDSGLYALDEPLYSMQDVVPNQPTTVMTEAQLGVVLRHMTNRQGPQAEFNEISYWPDTAREPDIDRVWRFEAGTLPLSGRVGDDDMFSMATTDDLGKPWNVYFDDKDPQATGAANFVIAAPGPRNQRKVKTYGVEVINLRTDFSDSVEKRSRERSNDQEPWDESAINRDAQGQFASSETSAAKKARKERRKRREQRRARNAKRTAAAQQQATTSAPTKQRTVEGKQQQIAAKQRVISDKQREVSRKQRAIARSKAPSDTASNLAEWSATVGHRPLVIGARFTMISDELQLALRTQPVTMAEVLETGLGSSPKVAAGTFTTVFGRPTVTRRDQEIVKDPHRMARSTASHLEEMANTWARDRSADDLDPDSFEEWDGGLDDEGLWRRGVVVARQAEDGGREIVVSDEHATPATQITTLVSRNATTVLLQMNALAKTITSDGATGDHEIQQLAQKTWDRFNEETGFEPFPVSQAAPADLYEAMSWLADKHHLTITPTMPDRVLGELVDAALDVSLGRPIRLDDKQLYRITASRQEHA